MVGGTRREASKDRARYALRSATPPYTAPAVLCYRASLPHRQPHCHLCVQLTRMSECDFKISDTAYISVK